MTSTAATTDLATLVVQRADSYRADVLPHGVRWAVAAAHGYEVASPRVAAVLDAAHAEDRVTIHASGRITIADA